MAVTKRDNAPATSSAAPARAERGEPKGTLGFLNINIKTKVGNPIRVDAIRLMEGNKTHEQLEGYLMLKTPVFEGTAEEMAAEKQRRLAHVISQLDITFNPKRTDEEAELNLF